KYLIGGLSEDYDKTLLRKFKKHKWFVACQFHPEFKSKPFLAHPLFVQFVKQASKKT
ncbi:CTP synthetase, partial [bacterium]|nr:CTP synthetase [bacterium]